MIILSFNIKRKYYYYNIFIRDQIHGRIIYDVFLILQFYVQLMDPNLYRIEYVQMDGKSFKLWTCTSCEKSFKQQYLLRRHLPVHTNERKYKCDACDKSFNHQSNLSQHKLSVHSNLRPYVCDICQKTFSRVSILITHRKIHQGKQYPCELCSKSFHQKINLDIHLNTHTNERPYKCEHCSKGFNQKSNLTSHMKLCEKVSCVE